MANVSILVDGKPVTVNETSPGLFGKLGYQYANSPTVPASTTQVPIQTQAPTQNNQAIGSWYLSAWKSTGNASWISQPTLTVDDQVFTFTSPEEYIAKLQELKSRGATGPLDKMISEFQGAIPEFSRLKIRPQQAAQPQQPAPPITSAVTTANTSQLPPQLQETLNQLNSYLDKLKERGQVLNPNIEITPQRMAEFLSQAEREINPYYSGQLKLARESLQNQINYGIQNLQTEEGQLQEKYGRGVRSLGEGFAEQGFAQSGLRQRGERELAFDTQSNIDAARRQFGYSAGNAARTFAQQFGTSELPSFNIGEAPRTLSGESRFSIGTRQLPLYELSPDIYSGLVGEQEFARRGAVQRRQSELEGAERSKLALNQARQLII